MDFCRAGLWAVLPIVLAAAAEAAIPLPSHKPAPPPLAEPAPPEFRPAAPVAVTRLPSSGIGPINRLEYHAGFVLSGPPRFGGLSSLWLAADGSRLLALSDKGGVFEAQPRFNADGVLTGLETARLGPLCEFDGREVSGARADAEAISSDPEGGFLVSFEGQHRLRAYGALSADQCIAPRLTDAPPAAKRLPGNGGMEGLAVCPDGRVMVVAETGAQGRYPLWFRDPDGQGPGAWQTAQYVAVTQAQPTGLDALPDGRVFVIERGFSVLRGLTLRVSGFACAEVQAGAEIRPQVYAVLRAPAPLDNFEGIAARAREDGAVDLFLISDDNFNAAQRTLLLQFRLPPPRPTHKTALP